MALTDGLRRQMPLYIRIHLRCSENTSGSQAKIFHGAVRATIVLSMIAALT